MAGNKQVNSDLEILGKVIVSTVPNNTGTVLTYNAATKEISQRTNAQIIDDLGLINATNIAAAYYTKVQLQTSGQSQVHWGNLTNIPTTFTPSAHNHDDRYYTETESDVKFVPYTGANKPIDFNTQQLILNGTFEKKSNVFDYTHLHTDATTYDNFKKISNVASASIGFSNLPAGDIIITLPIRTSTFWTLELDIFSSITAQEKLTISGSSTNNSNPQVSCLTDTEITSEVKFCRDTNNNTILILKRPSTLDKLHYGKVNISTFQHGATYHPDLAVKSNYKVEFKDETTLTGITVNSTIKVDKVNFGTKNVDFTSGSINKNQNSVRHFRDVYQANLTTQTDKILSIKFPIQNVSAVMFRVEIDFSQYAANAGNFTGKLIVTFYRPNSIHTTTGLSAQWIGNLPFHTNTIKIGLDTSTPQNFAINIGEPTTDWFANLSFRVVSVEAKSNGFYSDYSKGWTHEFVSDETGFTGLVEVPVTVLANNNRLDSRVYWNGSNRISESTLPLDEKFRHVISVDKVNSTNSFPSTGPGGVFTLSVSDGNAENSHTPNWGSGVFQLFFRESPKNMIYFRQGTGAGPASAVWEPFVQFYHTGNISTALTNYYTKTESLGLFVGLTGVQTIAGTKTFSSSPVVPSPTLDNHAVNRKYITDNHYTKTEVENLIINSNADKFVTTISTSGEVEHMLNTYDVSAEFYDIATMFTVGARVQRITTNKINVEFDTVPANPVKVLIRKF